MGRVPVRQPLPGHRDLNVPMAPHDESRQQPLRPRPWFERARRGGRGLSGGVSCEGTSTGFFRGQGPHDSTFLHPLAPPALPGFHATMGALTPARRLFVPLLGAMNSAGIRTGLSVSCAGPSNRSASNHPVGSVIALTHYPSASRTSGSLRSGLRRSLAGSPRDKAESSSRALRTSRSPPVAPHLASRRRSYVQLQAGECVPEEDFHLSDLAHLQTH